MSLNKVRLVTHEWSHTLTAVGAEDSVTSVPAASCRTAGDDEFSRL